MAQAVAVEPHIVTRIAVTYASIREQLPRDQLSDVVPRLLGEVAEFLQRSQIAPTGPPLVRYFTVDYNNGNVEIEAGFPVNVSTLPRHDRVRLGNVPAGRYATVTHHGSYDTLVETTAALLEWRTQTTWDMTGHHKVTQWAARVERYEIGPPAEANPMNWRTEIGILVAE